MIHGETKIELYNPTTRIKKVYRDENTFQGGNIAKWLNPMGDNCASQYQSNSRSFMENPWKYMIGGLLMFRDAIPEGSEFMPAGNRMVAKGANGIENLANPAEMGSFNTIESSATANAITQVWDFTTNQGNGSIGCVCLTSLEGGIAGYGNPSKTCRSSGNYGYLGRYINTYNSTAFEYNAAKGVLADKYRYQMSVTNGILTVEEYKTSAIVGSVFSGLTGLNKTFTFDLSELGFPSAYLSGSSTSSYFPYQYVGNGKIRFACPKSYTVASGQKAYYGEFDCATHTVTKKEFTNMSSRTIGLPTDSGNYYNPPIFTTDNRVFVHSRASGSSAENFPLLVDLSNSNILWDGKEIHDEYGVYPNMYGYNPVNGLYFLSCDAMPAYGGSYGQTFVYDSVSQTVYPTDGGRMDYTYGGTCYAENSCYQVGGRYNRTSLCVHNPLYLATINNLSPTVTKTAAQTMKVNYTLTEV